MIVIYYTGMNKMNKELFMRNLGGGEGKLPYTHIVTCQAKLDQSPRSFGATRPEDISPSTVDNLNILSLTSGEGQDNTGLATLEEIQNNYYLARLDTGEYFGRSSFGNLWRVYWLKTVFTKDDVGKTIPIWLSTTPPLGCKASNNAIFFYKEVA